jgi:hypothetical protein
VGGTSVSVLRLGVLHKDVCLFHLFGSERQFGHPQISVPSPAWYVSLLCPRQRLLKEFPSRPEVSALTFEVSQAARDVDSLPGSAPTLGQAPGFAQRRKCELKMASTTKVISTLAKASGSQVLVATTERVP